MTALADLSQLGALAIIPDSKGIARALAAKLRKAGIPARIHQKPPADSRAILFLKSLYPKSLDESISNNQHAFRLLKSMATEATEELRLFVAVQDTGGSFGLDGQSTPNAWTGGLAGLAKTAAREWPNAAVKSIDLETGDLSAEQLADRLYQEILTGGTQVEIGLKANGERIALDLAPVTNVARSFSPRPRRIDPATRSRAEAPRYGIQQGDTIVVSGGARGVTAKCLVELAKRKPLKFALLGRSAPPETEAPEFAACQSDAELKAKILQLKRQAGITPTPLELNKEASSIIAAREIRTTLETLQSLGSEALYLQADVVDAASVQAALAQAREAFGPIHGFVHAAGVLADKPIRDKTDEQFDRVFKVKAHGLRNLLEATSSDSLKLICCFSSVAARVGNPGQADYACGNEILNKVCQAEARRRGSSCLVRSINWGPWDGGMVKPALAKHFAKAGVSLIPIQEGAECFADIALGKRGSGVELIAGANLPSADEGEQGRTKRRALHLHVSNFPYLVDHAMHGYPTAPMVLIAELGMRIAREQQPGKPSYQCRDVTALKGMGTAKLARHGRWFSTEATTEAGGTRIQIKLQTPEQLVTLNSSFVPSAYEAPERVQAPSIKGEPWNLDLVAAYAGPLFNRGDFMVLQKTNTISKSGCVSELVIKEDLPSPASDWMSHLWLLDGILQTATEWKRHHTDHHAIPFRIGRVTSLPGWERLTRASCVMEIVKDTATKTTWNAWLVSPNGETAATLEELEMLPMPHDKNIWNTQKEILDL